MSASGGTRGESANKKTKIFFGCSKTRRCGCLLEKMHEGRPFVCANETSDGKPREDHHTEAGATGRSPHGSHQRSSHRHKQTAMPTCTLSTQTCMISYFRRQRILLLLFHSPTHPHTWQPTREHMPNEQKKTKHCGGITELMSRASYCVITQNAVTCDVDKRSRVRSCTNER